MAHLIPNTFSSYELTDQECVQGSIYNEGQKQVLQNHLASIAEEKLALELDLEHPSKFAQQEASLKGQMDIIRFILDSSLASEELVNTPAPAV